MRAMIFVLMLASLALAGCTTSPDGVNPADDAQEPPSTADWLRWKAMLEEEDGACITSLPSLSCLLRCVGAFGVGTIGIGDLGLKIEAECNGAESECTVSGPPGLVCFDPGSTDASGSGWGSCTDNGVNGSGICFSPTCKTVRAQIFQEMRAMGLGVPEPVSI